MSYQEKRALVTLTTTVLIFALFGIYVVQTYNNRELFMNNDFRFWGKTFLIMIPVMIVVQIVIHIIFNIIHKIVTNEDPPVFMDERDKLIDLKAIRISHWTFTIGFLLSMGSQAIGMQPSVMFMTMVISGFISGFVAEIAKFYLYRKGL